MSRHFPTFGIRNISLFYLLGIFMHGWFVLPNWVFMFSRYLTRTEIGIVDGIGILLGLSLEVPSGIVTDLIGKKKALLISNALIILSCVLFLRATTFWEFLLGNAITFAGYAFSSGTMEAFAYDTLIEQNRRSEYDKVIGKYHFLTLLALVGSTAVGGILFAMNPLYPFVAWLAFSVVAFIICLCAKEPSVDTKHFTLRNSLAQFVDGMKTLGLPSLRKYLVPIFGIACVANLYQGLVRQSIAADFSLTGETFGYVWAFAALLSSFLVFRFPAIHRRFASLDFLFGVFGIFFLAFLIPFVAPKIALSGIAVFLLLTTAEKLGQPLISVLVNDRIASSHRVTVLSFISLFGQLPYILLVTFFAFLTDTGHIQMLYGMFLMFLFVLAGYVLVLRKYFPKLTSASS